jgi:anaerobic magnesium-protoporphyrin IX monomethyl ester cyclase
MEIVILNSPLFRDYNPLYDEDSLPPLGLGYIATALESRGHVVRLVDAVAERIPLANLVEQLRATKPAVVASNVFTTNYNLVHELFEALDFETHILIGGLATKGLHDEILNWRTPNRVDVVFGDGELITSALIEGTVTEAPIKESGNKRAFRVDQQSKYYVQDISPLDLSRKYFINEPVIHPFGFIEANIIASRGCIYNCSFCAAASSVNRDLGVRERSVESLCNELEAIAISYPTVTSIRVLDDLFLKRASCVAKATEVFSKFRFNWRSMAHVQTFQGVGMEELHALKRSGCKELFIGIESGSPTVLRAIHKTHDIAKIEQNLGNVLRAGIDVKGYFIYGFPDETAEDMEATFRLAQELMGIASSTGARFRTSVFQYRPYHGTEIFHDLQRAGTATQVMSVEPDPALSAMVGRLQFNFHSGNYAKTPVELVRDYIYRTTELNDGNLFDKRGAP